ncbi:ATP-binding cassette sub-family C member 4-like [Galleria mellonella]|uniref:ATP-binding cassette sub-family C member 4-like n=1 Tax=Galleria mellonella TaxID=7137 RepID=A0ABM3MRC2_GALME|nr:ATP-binding cassette sub-family C member 4-like [Galleria mellonella]
MPCQLLKCLEDKHNWNRTSVVKTNLRNFFAQLLIGELDVAIATSIENYHAKWVGASCADVSRVIPDPEEVENEGWQERALERKAQKLATKLAEQMFQERAEQLVQRAKDIVSSGPPPCECKPQSAVYSCFVKPPIVGGSGAGSGVTGVSTTAPPYWRKTFQDVTQLRAQIEDLKRETIKKADLKLMENNIAKMVHRSSVLEASSVAGSNKQVNNLENNKEQDIKYTGLANTDNISKYHLNSNKTTAIKKKQSDVIGSSKKINKNITGNIGKTGKTYKKNEQAYTVNVCFCDSQKYPSKTIKHHKPNCSMENECRLSRKDNTSKDIVSQMSSVRQTKPIYDIESTLTNNKKGKTSSEPSCRSNCVCFYKVPSNTSIDKLLETLTKWKYDLTNVSNQNTMPVLNNHKSKQISNNLNINIKTQESPIIIKSIKSDINSSISKGIEFEQYLPPTTESEYMGEINLDNDMFSGCNKKNNSFNKSSYRNKSQDKLNIPINCLSPETCNCKKCSEEKEIQKDQLTLCNNEEQTKMLQSKSQLSIEQTQKLQEQSDLISNTEDITTDMNENNKMKDLFPSNSQYYNIKFLGVTLANTNSQCILHDEYTLNVKNNKNILKNNETMNEVCYNNKDQSIKEEYRNINVDQRDEHLLACNCNIKFNEFKYFTGEKLSKQRVNFYENEKAVESQSFNDNVIIDKHEMCVCCNDNKFDNSRDLEVNTFHLLEEHLKNRLEEFRQSSCKSSCISLDEQEKIFSTIFQRVKQIISDSSNKIICKCLDEEPSLGSWNRAYCLLQEYLKTKIKRVGCCCVSFQNEEKFVPDVLDQVCHLIENDFERLKSLCKCKNTVNKSEENYLMTQNELPERDINNDSYNHYPLSKNLDTSSIVDQNYNTNKLSKLNSPIILAQNISAQVPSNLEMKTKSCDAMERKNKNVQITESHELLVNKYCNSSDICCHCNLPKNSRKPYSELFGTNEILNMENNVKSNSKYKTFNDGTQKKRSKPNIISRIFICWMCPVLVKGNKRDVEEKDLIVPNKQYDSERHGDKLERYWLEELERSKRENRDPSLWKALKKAYWLAYMPGAIYVGLLSIARTIQPLLFSRLLSYWTDPTMTRQEAGLYALGMLGSNFVTMMCQHHNNLFVMRFSLKIKIACSALLYRKVLRMSQVALGEVAGGKIVNLLSNDLARFDYAFMFLHYVWLIPIQTAVVLYLLYNRAGYAPFVGLFSVIILIFPIQAALTKLTAVIRRQTAQRTDRRIKLMNEIINGIQVIKMYAWEKPFQKVVELARSHETSALRNAIFVRSVFIGFMLFTDRTIMFITILTLVLSGEMISASTIYPIQQYFSIIQFNITMILPLLIASLSEMKVSVERIQGFMIMEERDDVSLKNKTNENYKNNIVIDHNAKTSDTNNVHGNKYSSFENFSELHPIARPQKFEGTDMVVELSGVTASWLNETPIEECTLRNISMRLRKGKLCAIIGPVGTGKTSLLQLLLKEMPLRSGSVKVNGTVSYSCQESWLFAGTVRQNIIFGLPYDPEKYKEVCRVCSLLPDFKQFPYGDLSLVGDRGVSLSGGQRARINLARAVYREADIYLLDDPLSAVDANVGRQLFEGCIKGYLSGKTVILVTHQLHYLKAADYLVILNNGTIENMGSYDELVKSEKEFSFLLSSLQEGESDEKEDSVSDDKGVKRTSMKRNISVRSENENPNAEKEQKQAAEERATGNLKWEVVSKYLKSVNSWFIVFLAFATLTITQATATTVDYWVSFWTNNVDDYIQNLPEGEELDSSLNSKIGPLTNSQYLLVHGCVILALIIFAQIRIATFVSVTMRASRNLHNMVFKKLIITVMRFFDTNPSGRILNRFSKDIGALDELLPRSILETLQMYFSMTSVLVLNAIALPWTLIPTAVLVVVFVLLLRWYLKAAQAVKRLEGTTKSPVFGMINSTLAGLVTIRSSNSQDQLQRQFDDAQDLHSSAFYTYLGGSSAFGLYLDAICLAYLGMILCIFILVEFDEHVIPVGSVGLAVTQSMTLTMLLQMAARFTADFLGQMTSVERVLEYTKLPCEKNMEVGSTTPPTNWPLKGEVKFENVFMKYGPEDPPVLKNLNFVIKEGWKVGVVGRTGAGKSSLISALFRLCDIDGSIKIDGVDTGTIAKKDLRSKISIIPQEPVLFSATIRYNLDPFENYSDDEIWRALELVELKEAVPALDYKVSEGGSNFSMGQRQLICLARAVLRSNKVLVMDEATANVDPQTDALIQKTIRNVFTSCTVITIAHRLNTIMDSDRVLVMDKGLAVEFDYPYILLSNPNSTFNLMVKETSESMSKVLYEIAKLKYDNDNLKR